MNYFLLFVLITLLGVAHALYLAFQVSYSRIAEHRYSPGKSILPGECFISKHSPGIPFSYLSLGVFYIILIFSILYFRLQVSLLILQIATFTGILLSVYLVIEQVYLQSWCSQRMMTMLVLLALNGIVLIL